MHSALVVLWARNLWISEFIASAIGHEAGGVCCVFEHCWVGGAIYVLRMADRAADLFQCQPEFTKPHALNGRLLPTFMCCAMNTRKSLNGLPFPQLSSQVIASGCAWRNWRSLALAPHLEKMQLYRRRFLTMASYMRHRTRPRRV
ncbi:hypothetical protein BKA80DRAFT_283017 [Phyllosticta citrichinensis]